MLTKRTVHTFLNSMAANMSKEQMHHIADVLQRMPGMHDNVLESLQMIRAKDRRILERKVNAAFNSIDRLEDARCATGRAIERHHHAQTKLEEKIQQSKSAMHFRQDRADRLHDDISNAQQKAQELEYQLSQFDAEQM